jgi:hypothetical protein
LLLPESSKESGHDEEMLMNDDGGGELHLGHDKDTVPHWIQQLDLNVYDV